MPWNNSTTTEPTLGIDVGNVLLDGLIGFGPVTLLDGAERAVTELVDQFDGRVHIISKVGPAMQRRTAEWFVADGFLRRVGIPTGHVHWVREHADKAAICAQFGVTHMVDDRVAVHRQLTGVPYRFLFGTQTLGDHIRAGDPEAALWPVPDLTSTQAAIAQTLHPNPARLLPRNLDIRPVSLGEARSDQFTFWPAAVLSLADKPRNVVATDLHQTVLFFEDIQHGPAAMRPVHVHRIIETVRLLNDEERLLIHCMGGIARSTAVTLALLVATGTDPDQAAATLYDIRPQALPNPHVLTVCADVLNLEHDLVTAVRKGRR